MTPTPEAVEAVSKAIKENWYQPRNVQATAALTAAMPYLTAHPAPSVTDDELGHIAYRAMLRGEIVPWTEFRNGGWHKLSKVTAEDYMCIGRAVRESLTAQRGAAVPELPEGWVLSDFSYIRNHNLGDDAVWYVEFERGDPESDEFERWHTTIDAPINQPMTALQAAIDAAQASAGEVRDGE